MKKITLIFFLVLTCVMLSSCKVKSVTPTPGTVGLQVPTSSQPQSAIAKWEYAYVIAQCQADMGTLDLVCYLPKTNDNTMLSSILSSKANEGWELAGVANTGSGDSATQTFIFKRQQ
jgi:hypothetical protein